MCVCVCVKGLTSGEVVPVIRDAVIPQTGGQLQPELVPQTDGVELGVDVQHQVHLETLTLTEQPRDWNIKETR